MTDCFCPLCQAFYNGQLLPVAAVGYLAPYLRLARCDLAAFPQWRVTNRAACV